MMLNLLIYFCIFYIIIQYICIIFFEGLFIMFLEIKTIIIIYFVLFVELVFFFFFPLFRFSNSSPNFLLTLFADTLC